MVLFNPLLDGNRGHTFSQGISAKVYITMWQEFELAYNNFAVQHASHYMIGTSPWVVERRHWRNEFRKRKVLDTRICFLFLVYYWDLLGIFVGSFCFLYCIFLWTLYRCVYVVPMFILFSNFCSYQPSGLSGKKTFVAWKSDFSFMI